MFTFDQESDLFRKEQAAFAESLCVVPHRPHGNKKNARSCPVVL